ncbi:hypothetical protein BKA67DRAFT_654034 [Truncatella angustata]|uniref:Fungal N-terminal domain-containing protein n=1 Tax=Truncatella angustata TaxID=152316 RepID=A0A9P8UYH8_9PEZI|nr:uncharacterized protein BKA67DRAFT_654034 [Truncatella angustata]KAH6660881.1 hypothetical protein BKA67DRAFT_654034 [Truncatella angustata]KAH8199235.1 hypothetical protein TruAng_006575 [Truncatella angustata]
MDVISATASLVALVQAGGMLLQVGKAFHETFISKDNDDRAEDAAARIASITEFMQKIELFQAVKLKMSPSVSSIGAPSAVPGSAIASSPASGAANVSNAPVQQDLDPLLKQCKAQLLRLHKKVQKMIVPGQASKMMRFWGAIRLKMKESEFAQIEATITTMLQQLSIFISLAQVRLSQQSYVAAQERLDEFKQGHVAMETQIRDASQRSLEDHASLSVELQKIMENQQMNAVTQAAAFEQSKEIILSSFAKLSISPRLDRSTSGLSGTTVASEFEQVEEEDLFAPIAPALIMHPGLGFREDRLIEPRLAKSLLDRVDDWLSPTSHHGSILCVQTTGDEDCIHDLCNRIVQEIAGSGARLLCYNGLPRKGPPPATGWYTMAHVIWWLAGQLLIPIPHKDGHMPSHGYVPNIEAVVERLEKHNGSTTYIVLYLLTRSCPTKPDRTLYKLLLERLHDASKADDVRILLFSDEPLDASSRTFALNTIVAHSQKGEQVMLTEWEPEALIDDDEDDDNDED